MVAQINHQILNTTEIKFDVDDLFTNGENHQGKTLPSEFKVTTSENSLVSKQAYSFKLTR